jgi:hypothetical protein
MSELMSNLVVNLKRKENLETFDSEAQLLYRESLANEDSEKIKRGLYRNTEIIGQLLSRPAFKDDRLPNAENKAYLRILRQLTKSGGIRILR